MNNCTNIDKIIKQFTPLVLRESSKYNFNSYERDDLIQIGYLALIKATKSFNENKGNFAAYVTAAVRNSYRSLLRDQEKQNKLLLDSDFTSYLIDDNPSIEDLIISNEAVTHLHKALSSLSYTERDFLNKLYIDNKSLAQIANENNVKYHVLHHQKGKILDTLYLELSS